MKVTRRIAALRRGVTSSGWPKPAAAASHERGASAGRPGFIAARDECDGMGSRRPRLRRTKPRPREPPGAGEQARSGGGGTEKGKSRTIP
eukprot:364069-Chlamydomonas_euryale.AAC.2